MWEKWPTICTLSGHKKTNSNDRYLITALHDRYFTVLHGWYRNVYYSTYSYNSSFKPTNTLFGRITPAYNMPPTWCGPYQGVSGTGRCYKDTMMQISQNQLCIYIFTMVQHPQWAQASSLSRNHDHTQTHLTR